uniref:Integrase, catalytic region, zinc finger, CCHC-type, peptidase aspartic, catalytic n=1 Tax=Tanacetum cinerariifolium TaxID=118510 RepID=A0A699HJY7_TANCI|nr:hypothetical protein [Tanacetum cinerariifolium]
MNQNYFEPNPCYDSNSFGFDQPPQYTIDHQEDLNQQSMNDVDDRWNKIIESRNKIIQILGEMDSTIPLNNIISQEPSSNVITTSLPMLPTEDLEDSLIMGNEELNAIPEKESDEFIKSSVENLVPILSESEDTSGSDSECILPSCVDFSPIDIPEEKAMTFSNPLFKSNDDFISSDDESLSDEEVSKDDVKIYLKPLFEFDDEYISSDVNPLFDEVLENIESKDSYDSSLDEPDLLVTPLFDANKNECFDSGGDDNEINVLDCEDSYYDSEGDILYLESLLNDDLVHHNLSIPAMSVASILERFTDEPPPEENDDLFNLESKNDDWKKILYDAPIDDLMTEEKVFTPGFMIKIFLQHMIVSDLEAFRARGFVHPAFCSGVLVSAIWFCDLVLRFGSTFWFCILLIEDNSCVLPREDSAHFKTQLRFVSRFGCVLSQDFLRFVSKPPAFCLKTLLCFVSRPPALYCRGKENGVNILKSINEGPFQMGTVQEPLAERTEEAPHLELTKEDRESQLYDDFEHFRQHKGETIHNYYVWFAKLINDMRNIKMTMPKMQLKSKFVNNMLPEWGRFVTAVKHNRGLRDSNYDQLYAYLKQHETHANENKMMLDRFSQHTLDPLALMSNVSHQQHYSQSSSTPFFTYVPPPLADNTHFQNGRVMVQNVQGRQNRGHGTNPQGGGAAGYGGVQNRVRNANPDKMLLMQAQDNGVSLDEEQLLFLAGGHDTAIDEDVDEQPVQDIALNMDNVFQADDCDAFDSDVDEAPTVQTMFMANLSSADPVNDEPGPSYDSDILSEVQAHDHYQDTVCTHHEEHAMHDNVQLNHVVDSHADYTSDSNMIPYDQYVKDNAMPVVHSNVSYVPNDAYMMIYNDMYEPHTQSVSKTSPNTVVENSLNAERATYKE